LIERFDRQTIANETRRLHIVDACQLLGIDRTFKYAAATIENLIRCIEACNRPARARLDLLAWVLFNLLTGNGDAHLKNLSFVVSARGVELAPFYDLVSTECYHAAPGNIPRWPETNLTMEIGAASRFREVTATEFQRFAAQLGVNRRATLRLLEDFTGRIEATADALYGDFEKVEIPQRIVRAGQLKVLRSIRWIVVKEMVARLRVIAKVL
jgi:serine/threonine-protein kinase HipA